jgi:hypothetical protein
MTHRELLEEITQNLDGCGDSKLVCKVATLAIGPKVTFNEDTQKFEISDE